MKIQEKNKIVVFEKNVWRIQKIWYLHALNKYLGLPHTQGDPGIQGNSGNLDIFFKLREVLIFSKKFWEVLILKESKEIFLLGLERDLINMVQYFLQKN